MTSPSLSVHCGPEQQRKNPSLFRTALPAILRCVAFVRGTSSMVGFALSLPYGGPNAVDAFLPRFTKPSDALFIARAPTVTKAAAAGQVASANVGVKSNATDKGMRGGDGPGAQGVARAASGSAQNVAMDASGSAQDVARPAVGSAPNAANDAPGNVQDVAHDTATGAQESVPSAVLHQEGDMVWRTTAHAGGVDLVQEYETAVQSFLNYRSEGADGTEEEACNQASGAEANVFDQSVEVLFCLGAFRCDRGLC